MVGSVCSQDVDFFSRALADDRAVLAPMAGYSDAPFRRLCRRYGSAWAVTEMVSARALANGDDRTLMIGAPYPGEPDLVIQLFASDPSEAAVAARRLQTTYRPAAIDLNMGCPVKKIVHRGCGVELMSDPDRARAIVRAVREATHLPVSTKMRLGKDRVRVEEAALAVVEGGASLVAVHGRTGVQRYAGEADWSPIAELAARLPVPVVGSGDVTDAATFRARRSLGVGVMIARGALGRPWIFAEVRGGAAPTWPEAADVLLEHARLQVEWYGESRGIRSLRGHLARYVAPYPEAAGLRDALVRAERLEDVAGIVAPRARAEAAREGQEDTTDPPRSHARIAQIPAPAGSGGPLV